jgi:putative phosphoesterase
MSQTVKILVIGDTHVKSVRELPEAVINAMNGADMIIHLGDFGSAGVYRYLAGTGRLQAVFGNHDGSGVRKSLKEKEIIEVNGKKLALIHGCGCYTPFGIRSRLLKRFKGEEVDAVLFGHMHVPGSKKIGGVLFFNPGSTANKFPSPRASYGLLTIDDDTIHPEIHYLADAPHPARRQLLRQYIATHLVELLPPRRKFVLRRALISMAFAINFSLMTAVLIA